MPKKQNHLSNKVGNWKTARSLPDSSVGNMSRILTMCQKLQVAQQEA